MVDFLSIFSIEIILKAKKLLKIIICIKNYYSLRIKKIERFLNRRTFLN